MVDVYLEVGKKRVFACAVDWPGWARGAKDADGALALLEDYRARYAPVAAAAGFPPPEGPLRVVETVLGDATTDFGAPGRVPVLDAEALSKGDAGRLAALVRSCWVSLDATAAVAPPTLRKGPRGGGRDRDDVVRHVLAAEVAYSRKVGLRWSGAQAASEVVAFRAELARLLAEPAAEASWPVRYAGRRIGWHVLDHAWEIEDKS
ncbi:MAG: hypothetical protein M3N21_03590 [Actinomycetota bacterium]|nr:hypothetical protein [Actinomycetota bacterium]